MFTLIAILSVDLKFRSLTTTKYGRPNTIFGVVTWGEKYYNPVSLKGKSVNEMWAVARSVNLICKKQKLSMVM